MRFDEDAIDTTDDQIFDISVRGSGRRDRSVTAGDQLPHFFSDLVSISGDLGQLGGADFAEGALRGTCRCNSTEDSFLVAEDLDIGDRGSAVGDRYREVREDSPAVVDRIVAGEVGGEGVG